MPIKSSSRTTHNLVENPWAWRYSEMERSERKYIVAWIISPLPSLIRTFRIIVCCLSWNIILLILGFQWVTFLVSLRAAWQRFRARTTWGDTSVPIVWSCFWRTAWAQLPWCGRTKRTTTKQNKSKKETNVKVKSGFVIHYHTAASAGSFIYHQLKESTAFFVWSPRLVIFTWFTGGCW